MPFAGFLVGDQLAYFFLHLREGVRNKRPQDLKINIGELLNMQATATEHVFAELLEHGLVGRTHVVNDSGRAARSETGERHLSFAATIVPIVVASKPDD